MMDLQNFALLSMKPGNGRGNQTGQGKAGLNNQEFQNLLESMGLFAAMQNLQIPAVSDTGEAVPEDLSGGISLDMAQLLDAGTDQNDAGQLEKLLFWSRQNLGTDQNLILEDGAEAALTDDLTLQQEETAEVSGFAEQLAGMQEQGPGIQEETPETQPDIQAVLTPENHGKEPEPEENQVQTMQSQPPVVSQMPEDQKLPKEQQAGEAGADSEMHQEPAAIAGTEQTTAQGAEEPQRRQAGTLEEQQSAAAAGSGRQAEVNSFHAAAGAEDVVLHVPVSETDFTEVISHTLEQAVRTGKDEFEIQLEPEHLGRIAIKVTTQDHQTVISLSCSQEKTLQLLAQNAKEIGLIMENNLGTPPQILVEKQTSDYLEQQNQQGQQQGQNREEQQKKRQRGSEQDDFLQKLRVGLLNVSG